MDYKLTLCAFALFGISIESLAQSDSSQVRELKEVIIKDMSQGDFGQLYQVEGFKLSVGKKTEVVEVEKLNVNKATNNTRQVFGKVSGLNIFENDGSGLQLSVGGRGLDPNRTANFNVRQNGYDISADALGYPESYYTPPSLSLKRIEVIKGAASLQFGTQFGGLLNFVMKQPGGDKKFGLEAKQTIGSWGFLGSYNAVYGTVGKLDYLAYVHYKQGKGWRENSKFSALNAYLDLHYHIDSRHEVGIEYTHLNYLAQQPGGLDDQMFAEDSRQSNRSRNWFAVNWDLVDLDWNFKINANTKLDTRINFLHAKRNAVGFRPNRPSQVDNGGARDLLSGDFKNLTLESRLMHHYNIAGKRQTILAGLRYYSGFGQALQANVQSGSNADFSFNASSDELLSDYRFPNQNVAGFLENVIRFSDKLSIAPGARFEYIKTHAQGQYFERVRDLRDSVISEKNMTETKDLPRSFVLFGLGASYRISDNYEVYGNFSQNYRSVTFTDLRTSNPSFQIAPDISDEKGWSSDLGLRGNLRDKIKFDLSLFLLNYQNRIGEYYKVASNARVIRERDNVGAARVYGIESLVEIDWMQVLGKNSDQFHVLTYSNLALTKSRYTKSQIPNVVGNELEYVPLINWRAGLNLGYQKMKATLQISHLSQQFTDATNAVDGGYSAVNGIVPAYTLLDLTLGYEWRMLSIEGSINNLADARYYTRRATGYPGPGIIPGEGRAFYLTLGLKI